MKDEFSNIEIKLLNKSLLELVILQYLFQIKQQITRYKLLQQIQKSIGKDSISTAKFYRILEKLESNGLVDYETGETNMYYITSKGVNALGTSKTILGQIGVQVTSFFAEYMKQIITFSRYKSGRVLFVDFPEIYDLMVLTLTEQNTNEMSILCDDDTFKWLSGSLKKTQQSKYENNILKEPDNSFDLAILFYPGLYSDNFIFQELFRTLRSNTYLLVIDSVNPKEIFHHFAVDILIKQYWPIDYEKKRSMKQIEDELNQIFSQKPIDALSLNGLELRLYQKE